MNAQCAVNESPQTVITQIVVRRISPLVKPPVPSNSENASP